jgi:hypothetical protein
MKHFCPSRIGLLGLTTIAFSAVGTSQGINLDFDRAIGGIPSPASTYAAAGTAGVWNAVTIPATGTALVDKSGAPTGVTVTVDTALSFDLWFDNVNTTGDDANLMEDLIYGGLGGVFYPITFTGIAPGNYEVYTYAMAPDNKTGFLTDVDVVGSLDGVQAVGGTLFTGHAQGATYAKHSVTVTSGTIVVNVAINTSFISVNGIQIEAGGSGGGNSGASDCDCIAGGPCFTVSGAGHGCPNSNASGLGAKLTGSGSAAIASDTFSLAVTDAAPSKPGLILSGTASLGPGGVSTVPDSAGLLCVGGSTRRGSVVVTDATGAASFPDFQGAPYGASDIVSAGSSVSYTHWFRDPGTTSGCPNDTGSSDFNFSNGWTVTWN